MSRLLKSRSVFMASSQNSRRKRGNRSSSLNRSSMMAAKMRLTFDGHVVQ